MTTAPSEDRRQNTDSVVSYAAFRHVDEGYRQAGGRHSDDPRPQVEDEAAKAGWGHRLLMLVCCTALLILLIALVASGVAGGVATLFAVL